MADDDFDDVETGDQNTGGGALRKRLEEALAENKKLRAVQAESAAKDLISEKGFKYVKPSDLAAVPLEEFETVAQRIEDQKITERRQLAVEMVAESTGLEGEALELAVTEFLSGKKPASQDQQALANLAALGRAGGTPAQYVRKDTFGPDTLRAAFGV